MDNQYDQFAGGMGFRVRNVITEQMQKVYKSTTQRYMSLIALLLMLAFEALFHLCKAPRQHPWRYHISMLIIWTTISFNIIRTVGESIATPENQLLLALIIAFLNFLSLYEDKSRFSEADCSMLGVNMTCRTFANRASKTGLIFDAIGILILLFAIFTNNGASRGMAVVAMVIPLIILVFGTIFSWISIDNLMKDGSPSDLRGLDDQEKPAQMRIATDSVRGGLNAGITVLSIFAAMQGIVTHDHLLFGENHKRLPLTLLGGARFTFEALVAGVPIILSILNTKGQHEGGAGLGVDEIDEILPN